MERAGSACRVGSHYLCETYYAERNASPYICEFLLAKSACEKPSPLVHRFGLHEPSAAEFRPERTLHTVFNLPRA